MSINFQQQSLETELPCNGEDECVDFVRIRLPFGNICTSCDHLPVSCREVETGFSVSQMLHFDGNESLVMEFQSNRDERFIGFEFMVTCVQEAYFISPGCSTPPELNDTSRRRRDANFMVSIGQQDDTYCVTFSFTATHVLPFLQLNTTIWLTQQQQLYSPLLMIEWEGQGKEWNVCKPLEFRIA